MTFFRTRISNKKLFKWILLILLVLFIIGIAGTIYKINFDSKPTETQILQSDYTKVLTLGSGLKEVPPGIKNNFEILNSTSKDDKERYEALLYITRSIKSGYSIDHTPEARIFIIERLGPYAKENFPKLYIPSNFDMPCLDNTCGASINSELQNIIDLISETELNSTPENKEYDEYNREVILGNLTNMALLNESGEQFEIISLGTLVINQLEQYKKTYDEPAKLLKDYLEKKYNFDYEKEKEEFKNEKIK